jgi:hypothetical protein
MARYLYKMIRRDKAYTFKAAPQTEYEAYKQLDGGFGSLVSGWWTIELLKNDVPVKSRVI